MLTPLKYWIMTNELAAVLVFRLFPNVCIIVLFKAKLNIAESAIPSIGNVYAPLIAGASLISKFYNCAFGSAPKHHYDFYWQAQFD